MGRAILTNARDAHVAERFPARNHSDTVKMFIDGSGSNNTRFVYIYFSRPFPLGVTILDAKLRLRTGGQGWSGSHTMFVRRVSEKWGINRINWNNRPDIHGVSASVSKTNPGFGEEWEFDVSHIMQVVSNGAIWWGFRVAIDSVSAGRYIFSTQAAIEARRPELEVTWADNPDAPEDLRPDGGRAISKSHPILQCDFTDLSGDTTMAGMHVQINSTDSWANPAWDSGELQMDEPELDLSDEELLAGNLFPGLADGEVAFWRVRVQDGAGLWSGWSDAAEFRRMTKGTIELINPAAPPDNVIEDTTPPIFWNFTGRVQSAYQVIVAEAGNLSNWLWDSGKITSNETSMTIPRGVIKNMGMTYNIRVRIWDTIDREVGPGDPRFAHTNRDFTYRYDPTVDTVSNLQIEDLSPWPGVKLTWSRSSAPDEYTITRNGQVVQANIHPSELHVSGTDYEFTDLWAPARESHTWRVLAIRNGKTSENNPVAQGASRPVSYWLMEQDGSNAVVLMNPDVGGAQASYSSVHRPMRAAPVVLSQHGVGGFEGSAKGVLTDGNEFGLDLSGREQRNRFKRLSEPVGKRLILFMVDEVLDVFIVNPTYRPVARADGGVDYLVEFDFYEVN